MPSKPLAAFAALSLIVAGSSAAAQATSQTSPPTSESARTSAEMSEDNALRGTTLWIVGAIALALLIWGLIELLDDGDEDVPVSP